MKIGPVVVLALGVGLIITLFPRDPTPTLAQPEQTAPETIAVEVAKAVTPAIDLKETVEVVREETSNDLTGPEEVKQIVIENLVAETDQLSPIPDSAPVNNPKYTNKYDDYFRLWTKKYWGPQYDWRLFKAQAIQESGLRPAVASYVGAQGLMQIMPATLKEIRADNQDVGPDPHNPEWNTAAGIFYMKKMHTLFKSASTADDQMMFARCAYNGGSGNCAWGIRRCQELKQGDCNSWAAVATAVINRPPKRWIYRETLGYVSSINVLLGLPKQPIPPR